MQQIDFSINAGGQYLTFTLGGDEYGVNILCVREIREWKQVRSLPDTPEHVVGVLDLRGTIVPIIDLRKRFKLDHIEYGCTTVIIVLSIETDARQLLFGVVVDGVSEVLDISTNEILDAPDLGKGINIRYLEGMVTLNKRMVILLDVDRMLNPEELALL